MNDLLAGCLESLLIEKWTENCYEN